MNTAELDLDLAILRNRADNWARLPLRNVIDYLEQVIFGYASIADEQVAAALAAKQFPRELAGEEYLAGPVVVLRNLQPLLRTLRQIEKRGSPQIHPPRRLANGQLAIPVFPDDHYDRLLFTGFAGDVWLQPGITGDQLYEQAGAAYRTRYSSRARGKVAVVLCAGNVTSLVPLDIVQKLFVERQCVLAKINPVNRYMAHFVCQAFAPLIHEGYLRVVEGGADVGDYVCSHLSVDEIHMTGSATTHDAVVFGGGAAGVERKTAREARTDKRVTSELGNVSPLIVVPGKWSSSDLRFHADNIATQLCNNAGFNCNALRVLITARGWPQRHALLDALGRALSMVPPRVAYYPGARERYERFASAPGKLREYGAHADGKLPWGLLTDVDPAQHDHVAFRQEAFCSFAAETALAADDPASFLDRAVEFCNDVLWGTLSATVIVKGDSRRRLGDRYRQAIARLRYGTISINQWAALGFLVGTASWGAFPGHPLHDIQSGRGTVHNALLLPHVERSVIRAPFRTLIPPPWYVTSPRLRKLAPQLAQFEAHRKPWALPRIFDAVLRG